MRRIWGADTTSRRVRKAALSLVAATLLLSGCGRATDPGPTSAASEPSARISGTAWSRSSVSARSPVKARVTATTDNQGPYVVTTDDDGTFSLVVPPGRYVVSAVPVDHPNDRAADVTVTVSSNATTSAELVFNLP